MTDHIYVFQSKNSYLVNQKIEEHLNILKVDPFNVIRYDLLETNSDDVLEDLQTVSFFSELKVIIVDHIESLEKENEKILDSWIHYFSKPNPDVVLIIKLRENLNAASPLQNGLKKYAYFEDIKALSNEEYIAFIIELLGKSGYEISSSAAKLFLERIDYNPDFFEQEIFKLKLYTYDVKKINEQDIMGLVPKNLEDNIFELIEALLANNRAKTHEIYEDLIIGNEDPLRILNFVVNKMRELLQAKLLLNKGYSKEEIADFFGYSSGRTYYLLKNANQIQMKTLENQMQKLADLDYQIKSGQKDKKLGLELYLLGA